MVGAICYILAASLLDFLARWWGLIVAVAWVCVSLFVVAIVVVGARREKLGE